MESKDNVSNPKHYTEGSFEVIEMMEKIWGIKAVRTFCELNSFKYRMRAGIKTDDPTEDILKALWYENYLKNLQQDL